MKLYILQMHDSEIRCRPLCDQCGECIEEGDHGWLYWRDVGDPDVQSYGEAYAVHKGCAEAFEATHPPIPGGAGLIHAELTMLPDAMIASLGVHLDC